MVSPHWAPFEPDDKSPWVVRRVGHLYRRTSFGATADELEAGLKNGPDKTIDSLLRGGPDQEKFDSDTAALADSITRNATAQFASFNNAFTFVDLPYAIASWEMYDRLWKSAEAIRPRRCPRRVRASGRRRQRRRRG